MRRCRHGHEARPGREQDRRGARARRAHGRTLAAKTDHCSDCAGATIFLSHARSGGDRTLQYVKNLVSFGTWQYYESLALLETEAKRRSFRTHIFRESDLDIAFYKERVRLFADRRGFGYWSWKPHVILKVLESASENDIFLYVDSGNAIISSPNPLLVEGIRDEKGVVLFDNSDGAAPGSRWINRTWTKPQTFALMGCEEPRYLQGPQVNASYIVFRRTEFCRQFFAEFSAHCARYDLVADPAPDDPLPDDFVEHRHDQSVLSLLAIRHGVRTLRDPSQWGNARRREGDYPQVFDHHRRSMASLAKDPRAVSEVRGLDPLREATARLRALSLSLQAQRRRYADLLQRYEALRATRPEAGAPDPER